MYYKFEKNEYDLGETSFENIFLNDFMPSADGNFVKVYLLGYKMAKEYNGLKNFSNSILADILGILESDVLRAWKYWENQGIVKITNDENSSIEFINLKELYIKNVYNLKQEEKVEKNNYNKVVENPEIANLLTRAEFLLRESIPPMKKMDIAHWISAYNMPASLIEEAIFYATEVKNIYNLNYIEKIVRNWSKENIRTIEDIEKSYIEHDEKYYRYNKVLRLIGLEKKQFTQVDFNIINSWFSDLNFTMDIVTQACKKTANISTPSVNYVDAILRSWHKKGIKNVEDIEVKDKKRPKVVKTKFHNFKQITDKYSEEELEEMAKRKRQMAKARQISTNKSNLGDENGIK